MRPRRFVLALLAAAALAPPAPAAHAAPECTDLQVSVHEIASVFCEGVHPGMLVRTNHPRLGDHVCTAGFMYADSRGRRYLSIPGTCLLDYVCKERAIVPVDDLPPLDLPPTPEPLDPVIDTAKELLDLCLQPGDSKTEPVYAKEGPVVRDEAGFRIGTVAYAVNADGVNFGLVRLDAGVASSPAVPHWGGPTRLQAVMPAEAQKVLLYQPISRASSTPGYNAAPGVAPQGFSSTTPLILATAANALDNAEALVLSEEGAAVGTSWLWFGVQGSAVRPQQALARVAAKAKLTLKLMTAPLSAG